MGDFVPGSDFIPGSDYVPGVGDVLGIDIGIDGGGWDPSQSGYDPSQSGYDPSQGSTGQTGTADTTTTPTDTTGSPYGSGTSTNTTGGPTDIGSPATGTPTETGGGGYSTDQFGSILNNISKIPNIPGTGTTGGGGTGGGGTGTGTGKGTGTGTGIGSDPYSSAVIPQVTPGSSAPINLTSGDVKAETFGSPVNFATGGTTDMGLSNENWLRDNPNPSLSHNVSHGRTFAPISLINKPAGFENLVPAVKPELYAEGGEAEHTPEFYSEGGMRNTYVQGDGDGTSDSVPAMLANGEFVIPADVVSSLGNGSNDSGSKVLDNFLQTIRQHKQQHAPNKLPPDSKGVLSYLSEANHKVKK